MIQYISIMLTNRCNSRCKYCYVDAKPTFGEASSSPGQDLDLQLLRQFLQAYAKQNGRVVHFTGGEALLYPHIEEVLAYTKSLGLVAQIFTNGLLLDQERFLRIKDFVSSFAISLDGSQLVHDANRGVKGAYQKVIDVLQLFKDHCIDYSLQMTVGKSSITEIAHVAEIARQYNAGSVKLANLMPVGRGLLCPEEQLSEEDLLALKHKAFELAGEYSYRPIFQTNLYTQEEIAMYFKSDSLLPFYWVDPAGDFYLFSPSHPELFRVGQIADFPFAEIEQIEAKSEAIIAALLSRIRGKLVCDLYQELELLAKDKQ